MLVELLLSACRFERVATCLSKQLRRFHCKQRSLARQTAYEIDVWLLCGVLYTLVKGLKAETLIFFQMIEI